MQASKPSPQIHVRLWHLTARDLATMQEKGIYNNFLMIFVLENQVRIYLAKCLHQMTLIST